MRTLTPRTIASVAGLIDLDRIIAYLESTTDDQWCENVVRSDDGARNCVMGHVYDFAGGDAPLVDSGVPGRTAGSLAWDWFEEHFATTFMIYPVNDGQHPSYQQPTPRERCLAYLVDLRDGRALTTGQLMERDAMVEALDGSVCFR